MQETVLLLRGENGPVGVFTNVERRPQHRGACGAALLIDFGEFGARKFGVILISDGDLLSAQVASVRAGDAAGHRQLGSRIYLARRDLDGAGAPTVRPD